MSEQLYVKNIENGIRAIKMRTKAPQDLNLNDQLKRLRVVNEGMAQDLNEKYVNAVNEYNKQK